MNGEIFEEILESMAVAVLVLDRAGEVVFANRAARALEGCAVTVDGWTLQEWVRCSRGSVQMKRAGCGESLAHVSSRMIGDCRVIFIWVFPRDRQGVQRILMDLYALTPQEARLAVELCFSTSLADVARDLGIAMDTARTHLKRVFSKTDTKKQSQLVLLVATCAMALPHESPPESTVIPSVDRNRGAVAAGFRFPTLHALRYAEDHGVIPRVGGLRAV